MKCYACGNEIQIESGKCPHCGFTIVRMTGDPYAYHEMMLKAAEDYRREHMMQGNHTVDMETMRQEMDVLRKTILNVRQENNMLRWHIEEERRKREEEVLDVQDGKALILSRFGLDVQAYKGSVTWSISSLRTWLNKDFLISAFSSEEQKKIVETPVHTEDNEEYGTYAGRKNRGRYRGIFSHA